MQLCNAFLHLHLTTLQFVTCFSVDGRDRRCVYSDGDAENLSVEELRALARADRPAKKPKAAKRKRRTKKVVSDESASDDANQIEAGAAEDIEMAGASADAADAVDAAESESEREGGEESSEPEMVSVPMRCPMKFVSPLNALLNSTLPAQAAVACGKGGGGYGGGG